MLTSIDMKNNQLPQHGRRIALAIIKDLLSRNEVNIFAFSVWTVSFYFLAAIAQVNIACQFLRQYKKQVGVIPRVGVTAVLQTLVSNGLLEEAAKVRRYQ